MVNQSAVGPLDIGHTNLSAMGHIPLMTPMQAGHPNAFQPNETVDLTEDFEMLSNCELPVPESPRLP